jgi:hypothetical protein
MAARKKKTVRVLAAEAGLSLGHITAAMKAGVDVHDPKALKKYRDSIPARVDSRSEMTTPSPNQSDLEDAGEMTIEDIERALKSKAIDITSAKRLKTQLDGLKAASAVRKEMNQLISREELAQRDIRLGAAVSAALRVMETELPQLCLGLPLERSRPIVKDAIRKIQGQLADGLSQFWKDHPEQ